MDVSRWLQQCPPCLVSGFRRGDAVPGLWYKRFHLGIVGLQSREACYIRMLMIVDPVASEVFVPGMRSTKEQSKGLCCKSTPQVNRCP